LLVIVIAVEWESNGEQDYDYEYEAGQEQVCEGVMNVRGGILWIALLLPFAGGCVAPHMGGLAETSAAIGVCLDDGSENKIHEAVAEQLQRQDVELIGCLGAKAEAGRPPQLEWRRPRQFEGVAAAAPLPQRPADARFGYSFERGPLHLTVIETAEPMTENSEAYHWLMEDLSLANQPWKVVILSRPIVSPSPIRVDEDRMDLAVLLAKEGVALAIATGGPAYFRTARIGESRAESVRYVILGGDGWSAPPKPAPEWTVSTIAEPCFCLLEVKKGRLRWTALNLQGRLLDVLEVPAGERPASQAVSAGEGSESHPLTAENASAGPPVPPGKVTASQAQSFTWSEVLASERAQTATGE